MKYDRYLLNKTLTQTDGKLSYADSKYPDKLLPMWIADMDLPAPPAVIEALKSRVDHSIFGYTLPMIDDKRAIQKYLKEEIGKQTELDDVVILPGLVVALNLIARVAKRSGADGQAIMTNTPIYPPFLSAPGNQGVPIVTSPLKLGAKGAPEKYAYDLEDMYRRVKEFNAQNTTKVGWFYLCNPHNPVGRSFTKGELEEVAEFCRHFKLKVSSDEVHCDLVLKTSEGSADHISFESVWGSEDLISLFAPSKTFNLAGLGPSYAVIKDAKLRQQFKQAKKGIVPDLNILGLTAMTTVYTHPECQEYKKVLIKHLSSNYALVEKYLKPIQVLEHKMESTYLAFLNAKTLYAYREAQGLTNKVEGERRKTSASYEQLILDDFNIGFNAGSLFGVTQPDGNNLYADYVRLNFGCTREQLIEALSRLLGTQIVDEER